MRGRRRSGGRQLWRWREGDGGIFGLFWKVLFLRANCGGLSVIYVRMIQKRYIPSCNKLWCRGLWVVIRLGGCWRGCGLELKLEQLLASCRSNYDGLMMMDNELFWTNSFWICNGKQWSLRRLWIKNRTMRFWLSSFSSHKLAKICENLTNKFKSRLLRAFSPQHFHHIWHVFYQSCWLDVECLLLSFWTICHIFRSFFRRTWFSSKYMPVCHHTILFSWRHFFIYHCRYNLKLISIPKPLH